MSQIRQFVNFFEDAHAAAAWLPSHREAAVLDLDDGFRLARLVYGDLYTDVPVRSMSSTHAT